MRISGLASIVVMPLLLSACCAPEQCYVAQSRLDKLDPVIDAALLFEEQHGRLPSTLEEAFPEGLPDGIEPVEGQIGYYRFTLEDDSFPTFSYGLLGRVGEPREEITLHFSYVGGGLIAGMSDCFWTETYREWACSGYI